MAFKEILHFDDLEIEKKFLGPNNQNLTLISTELNVKLNHISGSITIDQEILENNDQDVFNMIFHMLHSFL